MLALLVLGLASSAMGFSPAMLRPSMDVAPSHASSRACPFAEAPGSCRTAVLRMMADAAEEAEEFDIDAAVDAASKGEEAPAAETPAKADDDDDDDDLLSSPAFLKQKLKVLEKEKEDVAQQIEQANVDAAAQSEEWTDQRRRLQADFDNFRARHVNQTLEAQVEARIKLLQDFLPVLDNFDRARDTIKPEGAEQDATNARYQEMHAGLMATLTEMGMEKIPTVGTEFDYNMHMALQTVPSAEYDEDIVCAEMQPGYTVNGQLVRAAYVMVSSGA